MVKLAQQKTSGRRSQKRRRGAAMIEYCLIASLLGVGCVVSAQQVGNVASNVFNSKGFGALGGDGKGSSSAGGSGKGGSDTSSGGSEMQQAGDGGKGSGKGDAKDDAAGLDTSGGKGDSGDKGGGSGKPSQGRSSTGMRSNPG